MQKWSFNVDPLFNNAVDGLMYIRIADIPESTMKPVMEEFQAELERKSAQRRLRQITLFSEFELNKSIVCRYFLF
jgi:hypothetical protein